MHYVGCYVDSYRPLPIQLALAWAGNSIEACYRLAKAAGYAYYGVQFADECWAGYSLTKATSFGFAGSCSMTCRANSAELCGNGGANSVYQINTRKSQQGVLHPAQRVRPCASC